MTLTVRLKVRWISLIGVPCSLIRVATRLQRRVSIPRTFSRALGKSRGLQTESESLNPLCNKNSEEPCLCFKRWLINLYLLYFLDVVNGCSLTSPYLRIHIPLTAQTFVCLTFFPSVSSQNTSQCLSKYMFWKSTSFHFRREKWMPFNVICLTVLYSSLWKALSWRTWTQRASQALAMSF